MVTRSQCGLTRIQSASHFSRAATGQAAAVVLNLAEDIVAWDVQQADGRYTRGNRARLAQAPDSVAYTAEVAKATSRPCLKVAGAGTPAPLRVSPRSGGGVDTGVVVLRVRGSGRACAIRGAGSGGWLSCGRRGRAVQSAGSEPLPPAMRDAWRIGVSISEPT